MKSLDLLLLTGAGASREFGNNGRPLPLMADFSEAIIAELVGKPGYLEATNLERGLDGQEFERRLGRFLEAVLAFSRIDSVIDACANFQSTAGITMNADVLRKWYDDSSFHLNQAVDDIYKVTYEQFAIERISVTKAADAYRALFDAMGIDHSHRVVVATTNYDAIAEHALTACGWLPDSGEPHLTTQPDPPISVDRLLDGMPRYTPVLHLHGRLGWYRRPDSGAVYFAAASTHQAGLGVPVMVLPDPDKAYDEDTVIASLWAQFEEALRAARRVLILGHSLNDRGVVRALIQNVEPLDRIGVALLPGAQPGDVPGGIQTRSVIQHNLGNAAQISLRFESPLQTSGSGLDEWITKTQHMGQRPGADPS